MIERCAKLGCDKKAIEIVWADLRYPTCEDHRAEIKALTVNE